MKQEAKDAVVNGCQLIQQISRLSAESGGIVFIPIGRTFYHPRLKADITREDACQILEESLSNWKLSLGADVVSPLEIMKEFDIGTVSAPLRLTPLTNRVFTPSHAFFLRAKVTEGILYAVREAQAIKRPRKAMIRAKRVIK